MSDKIKRELDRARLIAAKLWMLLDDIDTAEDMVKSDNAAFRKIASRKHQCRFTLLSGEEVDAWLKGPTP